MKIFIASPWRNRDAVRSLEEELIKRGYIPYSFLDNGANLATGTSVIEELKTFGHSMTDWEDNDRIKSIFDSETMAIRESEVVVLLEPAGHSSLTQAGIAYGLGKKTILIGLVEHPEIVYRMFDHRYPNIEAFLESFPPLK